MMKKLIAMCALLLIVGGEVALAETSLVGGPITVAATSDANSTTQPKHRRTRRHGRRRRHNRRRR
jgi:Ni/Co efflux regulator RcnB